MTVRGRPAGSAPTLLLAALIFSACHSVPKPRQAGLPPSASPSDACAKGGKPDAAVTCLRQDIDAILAQPALERGYWGVLVKSLEADDALYARNAARLMMPASNMKIVTLAASAARLGWNYTYETKIFGIGTIGSGTLDGDLLVVGSGDPSLGTAGGLADRVFDAWAERLKAQGVRTILGRIVGDDNAFDDRELGFGWSWNDLQNDYAAGVSALQFNENAVQVTVGPGAGVGDRALVSISPAGSGLTIANMLKTSAADLPASIEARRLPGTPRLSLLGSVPLGATPAVRPVSVDNPTLFFVTALRDALIARGIDVHGPAADIDDIDIGGIDGSDGLASPGARDDRVPLVSYTSPPLSALAVRLMKISQNLYGETFLKTLGAAVGTPTAIAGRTIAQSVLQEWGIPPGTMIQRDGSGLSRYDYVTPEALVGVLTHVSRDEELREPFEASLPIAGRDGTLANRMKGTPAEGNARAKTGSMSNVRGMSGYVRAADGEPLVFSILANNFEAAPETINRAMDAIVVRLATLRRSRPGS
jgi:serine-type D-Ala-D-Ala carboxypeptidase/endopeptidase (penicillin-binding protein 4)